MADRKTDTIREIDALVAAFGSLRAEVDGVALVDWLAKIRAHAVADELERKRLQAEIMLNAASPGGRVFTEAEVVRILELNADWELAPQRAREAAKAMPPMEKALGGSET